MINVVIAVINQFKDEDTRKCLCSISDSVFVLTHRRMYFAVSFCRLKSMCSIMPLRVYIHVSSGCANMCVCVGVVCVFYPSVSVGRVVIHHSPSWIDENRCITITSPKSVVLVFLYILLGSV